MKVSGSGKGGVFTLPALCGCTGAVLVLPSFHARFAFDKNKGVRVVKLLGRAVMILPMKYIWFDKLTKCLVHCTQIPCQTSVCSCRDAHRKKDQKIIPLHSKKLW